MVIEGNLPIIVFGSGDGKEEKLADAKKILRCDMADLRKALHRHGGALLECLQSSPTHVSGGLASTHENIQSIV